MAQVGYCSIDSKNVYLDPDGSCPNGHGAEYVSNVYEVPDAPVPPPAPDEPAAPEEPPVGEPEFASDAAYAPPPPPAPYPTPPTPPPSYAPPTPPATYPPGAAPPKKKRTGLIIAIVVIVLLLLCGCCGIGFLLFAANSSNSSSSASSSTETPAKPAPDRAKIETAVTMVKAMAKSDGAMMAGVMPSETVADQDAAVWDVFVKEASAGAAVLGKETWSGSTLTIATSTNQGSGSLTFKLSASDPNTVELHNARPDGTTADTTFVLAQESGGWKIQSMSNPTTTIPFDLAGFKAFIAK